jgi:hypothetical protein
MKKAIIILSILIGITTSPASAHQSYLNLKVDSVLICVSPTGHKYHSHECRGLAKCTHEIRKVTKAQAIKMGYGACKICY